MPREGCTACQRGPQPPHRVNNPRSSRRSLEGTAREGDSPVGERVRTLGAFVSTVGTREILQEAGGTTSPRLNTLDDR